MSAWIATYLRPCGECLLATRGWWFHDKAACWFGFQRLDHQLSINMWMRHPETARQLHFCAVLFPKLSFLFIVCICLYNIRSFYSGWEYGLSQNTPNIPMVCHLSSAIKVTVLGPFISPHSEMPQELLSPNWLQHLLQKTSGCYYTFNRDPVMCSCLLLKMAGFLLGLVPWTNPMNSNEHLSWSPNRIYYAYHISKLS